MRTAGLLSKVAAGVELKRCWDKREVSPGVYSSRLTPRLSAHARGRHRPPSTGAALEPLSLFLSDLQYNFYCFDSSWETAMSKNRHRTRSNPIRSTACTQTQQKLHPCMSVETHSYAVRFCGCLWQPRTLLGCAWCAVCSAETALLPGSVFKDATVAAASPKSHEAIQWP